MAKIAQFFKSVPWYVWAGLATIGLARLWGYATGGVPIEVAGSGIVATLTEDDEPEDARMGINTRAHWTVQEAEEAMHVAINQRPAVLLFGLDAQSVADDSTEALAVYGRIAERAEAARVVPVMIGPVAPDDANDNVQLAVEAAAQLWRQDLCGSRGLRLCLDVTEHQADDVALRAAVATVLSDAMLRHAEWRASTQVGG